MKKAALLIALIIAVTLQCNSQFKEGYIITNDDKTLNGYINFQGSVNNSDRCEFRLQPEGDVQVYKPGEIKAFRFTNSKYFSSMEISVNNEPKMVFLEWLIKGRVSILEYNPSVSETRFFLITEDNSIIELANSSQNITRDSNDYNIEKQEYKNTLISNLADCPTLRPNIEASFLSSKSLINIAKEYHARTCDSWDCVIYEARDRKLKYSIGISGSYLGSHLILNSGKPEAVQTSNTIGYGFTIKAENLPALSPKFSAKLSMMIYSNLFRYDTTALWSSSPELLSAKIAHENRMCEVKYIRMPFQVSYKFTQKKINPYVSLGGTLNIRYSYKRYSQFLMDYSLESNGSALGSKISLAQYGLISGAGLEFKLNPNFSVDAGYDFEYLIQFFGKSINDYTRLMNHHVYISTFYRFN